MTKKDQSEVDEKKILLKNYELLCQRLLSEYEQRDRDFRMFITLNTGFITIAGAILNYFLTNLKTMDFALGVVCIFALLLLALFGWKFSRILQVSIDNFSYWQLNITANLAKLEYALLADPNLGQYIHILSRIVDGQKHLLDEDSNLKNFIDDLTQKCSSHLPAKNLSKLRENLATTFGWVWRGVFVVTIILSLYYCYICLFRSTTPVTDAFSSLW